MNKLTQTRLVAVVVYESWERKDRTNKSRDRVKMMMRERKYFGEEGKNKGKFNLCCAASRQPTAWVISTHESKYSALGANNKMIATQESNIMDGGSRQKHGVLCKITRRGVCYAYHGRKGVASYTMYSSSLSSMHLMIPNGSSALILLL